MTSVSFWSLGFVSRTRPIFFKVTAAEVSRHVTRAGLEGWCRFKRHFGTRLVFRSLEVQLTSVDPVQFGVPNHGAKWSFNGNMFMLADPLPAHKTGVGWGGVGQ